MVSPRRVQLHPTKNRKRAINIHQRTRKPLPVPQTSSPRAHTPPRNASPSPAPPAVVVTSSPVVDSLVLAADW